MRTKGISGTIQRVEPQVGGALDREQQSLESYLKFFSWVLFGVAFLPVSVCGREPLWPWDALGDASPADALALLLPLIGGVALFVLGRNRLGKNTRAFSLLLFMGLAWWVNAVAEKGPHSLLPYQHLADGFPSLFGRRLWLFVLATVLLVGGIRLGAAGFLAAEEDRIEEMDPWTPARVLTLLGISLVVIFYCLPWHGQIPLISFFDLVSMPLAQEEGLVGLAVFVGRMLSLGPLLLAVAAFLRLWKRAPDTGGMLAGLLLGYVPMLGFLMALRTFATLPAFALVLIRSSAVMLSVTAGCAIALAAWIRGLWFDVPWLLGSIGSMDLYWMKVLSESDPALSISKGLHSNHPMVRPFLKRRLLLWQKAAAAALGGSEINFSGTVRWMESRRREEGLSDRKDLSGWVNPRWVSLGVVFSLIGLAAAAVPFLRFDDNVVQRLGQEIHVSPVLDRVFEKEIPKTQEELYHFSTPFEQAPSVAKIAASLSEVEGDHQGLKSLVLKFLSLSREGRHRIHRTRRARDELNRMMLREGIPYYLGGSLQPRMTSDRDMFVVLTYHILDKKRYRHNISGAPFEVLLLSRADNLNIVESYVGATEEEESFVTLLLDRLEELVTESLIPMADRKDGIGRAVLQSIERGGIPSMDVRLGVDGFLSELLLEGLIRHELHHRWMGTHPEPPDALWVWMRGYSDDAVGDVAAEVGALLGELAYAPEYARLRIALSLESLQDERGYGGSHGMAARFLLHRFFGVEPESKSAWRMIGSGTVLGWLDAWNDRELMEAIDGCHKDLFGMEAPRFDAD
jgi:hypothetical protein